jgi:hypothetical protein
MSSSVQYVTDEDGQKTAVLMPIADYARLMENLADLAAIADRRKEPTVSHEEFRTLDLDKLTNPNAVLFDVKGFLPKDKVTARL